jgi:DnaJ-class molecular chaperone
MLGNLSPRTLCQLCAGRGYERARGLRESCVECHGHNSVLIRTLGDF